jgi:hypothetical protein
MSNDTPPSSLPAGPPASLMDLDGDGEQRWAAWKARGVVQDRVVRQRFVGLALLVAVLAVGALIGYGALFS